MAYLSEQKLSPEERNRYFKETLSNLTLSAGADLGVQLGFTPKYFDAMYAIGVKYYDNNRLDDAIKILYQLIALQPSAFRNYKAMGACLQAKEDYEAAINVYKTAIPLAAMDAETYFYIGQCLFLQKKFSEAANTLNLANVICAKYPEKWINITDHAKDLYARATARAKQ